MMVNLMKCVAIIPARGGSKRIPKKNIRHFAGKPIVGYSIEAAKATQLFDKIIVSTDDEEIAEVSRSFGAEVPFLRPGELSGDFVGTVEVVNHAIKWIYRNISVVPYICCLYATAPFVQPRFLIEGYERLISSGKSFAFSVTSYPFPIQRAVRLTGEGSVDALYPEFISSRSQDLEEIYHDAGQFYWGTSGAFLAKKVIFSHESVAIVIPRYLVQDIDTTEDWIRAELLYRAWQLMLGEKIEGRIQN
jgi:pseudaminic acid cytidylyltransferase